MAAGGDGCIEKLAVAVAFVGATLGTGASSRVTSLAAGVAILGTSSWCRGRRSNPGGRADGQVGVGVGVVSIAPAKTPASSCKAARLLPLVGASGDAEALMDAAELGSGQGQLQ